MANQLSPQSPYELTQLKALVSFEAAARNLSFKHAAAELNVTPAAISHQVKALEAELGQALFLRHPKGVELTEAGAILFVAAQRGFTQISAAVDQIRMRVEMDSVTIQATSAMSSLWLAPRLTAFWKTFGNIAVSQTVSDSPLRSPGCELRIYYGDSTTEESDCRLLFNDQIGVLAAPGFAERYGVYSLGDLSKAPLIHLTADDSRWTGWATWGAELDFSGSLEAALRVNNYAIALQAAKDGNGAVLGWKTLTKELVSRGELVWLLPEIIDAPHAFYIQARSSASQKARRLRDWLLDAAS